MASLFTETLYKIYADDLGPRASIYTSNDWASADFNFGKNKRLLQVSGNLMVREGAGDFPDGGKTTPLDVKWRMIGFCLDSQRNFLRLDCRVVLFNDPSPVPPKTFATNFQSIFLSNDKPEYKPNCLWMGGFLCSEIQVDFGTSYAVGSLYWGRLWLDWEFDSA